MISEPIGNDATQTLSVIQAGARFSHYQIVSKIGAGGMGDVFLAKDIILDRNVVLKFLSPQLLADESFKTRFLREARTAASLNDPNIITIYEIEESNDRLYIAMEQVKGVSLKDFLNQETVDARRTLEIVVQICSGLQTAHDNEIIHRDIKPDNIMISQGDFVKVLDFGLAKFKGEANLTQVGTTLGTVNYMSPEQSQGQEVDHRSDIFSVGIVFYEMITGRPAFAQNTIPATIYSIVHNDLPPLSEIVQDIPAEYQTIVDKCLAKEPDKRYQSISEMIEDLNAIRGHSQVLQVGYKTSIIKPPIVKSLAVLCLTNLSSPEDEFLCYGISEDLIVDLTRLGTFRVTPMRSVLKFRNSDSDLTEIADKLSVNYILDGSLMKLQTSFRVSAQLIEVSSGKNLWADRWEVAAEELPQIKTALAKGIGDALQLDSEVIRRSKVDSTQINDPIAYELYLRGKYTFDRKQDTSDIEVALGLYNQAITAQPSLLVARIGKASIYVHNGEYQKATKELKPSLSEARATNKKADAFRILLVMSEAQIRLSNWDQGRTLVKEALELAKDQKDLSGETVALRFLIDIHERRAEFDQALVLFERVMEINRQLDDLDMIAESLKSIANVHLRKGENTRARTLYEEAITIARKRGNIHLDAKCICNIGLTYSTTGQLDEALDCFEKALVMYKKVGDRTGQANAYNNMALVHSSRGSFRKAIEFGEQAAELEKGLQDNAAYALVICNIARYKAILGEYEVAITTANEALKIAHELNYPFVVNLANDSLGYCYYCNADFENALKYYRLALEVAEKSNLRREAGLALSNLASTSFHLNDLTSCRHFADRAIDLAREVGNAIAMVKSLIYRAVTTILNGEVKPGLDMLQRVLEDARQLGDPRFIIVSLRFLSQLIVKDQTDEETTVKSLQYINEALALAEKCEIAHELKLCRKAIEANPEIN